MNKKIIEIFTSESEELLQAMEEGLLALEDNPGDSERIHAVFRAAHTIKGNAGFIGLSDVVSLAHLMENALDLIRKDRLAIDKPTISLLLRGTDHLKAVVSAHLSDTPPVENAETEGLITDLARLSGQAPPPPAGPEAEEEPAPPQKPEAKPKEPAPAGRDQAELVDISLGLDADLFSTGTDPLMLLTELADLGRVVEVEADVSRLPALSEMNPEALYLAWRLVLETAEPISRLENVFVFVADKARLSIRPRREKDPAAAEAARRALEQPSAEPKTPEPAVQTEPTEAERSQAAPTRVATKAASIRVGLKKLDKLVNQVGELAIAVARVKLRAVQAGDRELNAALEAMDFIVRDIQDQVLATRMVPLEATFTRFRRLVRDAASELGKEVHLELSGAETELDRNIIEEISDPLGHLIRNAVDHGLESPQARIKAGKNETGSLTIKAYQLEGNIIIEVMDDGRGIDRRAVLARAVDQGLIPSGARPEERELFDLLFQPGFSTASRVTEMSGRGVGLDVVKRNLERIRGTIEVESVQGLGSLFRIRLPITLALIDGLTVRLGEEILTVPMLSIVESIRLDETDIKTIEGAGQVMLFRGEYIPLVLLYQVFELPARVTEPTEGLVVVVESRNRRFGLLVDGVEGEIQAVIKSLEENYFQLDGTAGATILGDGRVSLIIDVHSLERLAFERSV